MSLKSSEVSAPIRKRWFRNHYVVEYGKGHGTTYGPENWETAKECQRLGHRVYGPYWSFNAAKEAADTENQINYNLLFK